MNNHSNNLVLTVVVVVVVSLTIVQIFTEQKQKKLETTQSTLMHGKAREEIDREHEQ